MVLIEVQWKLQFASCAALSAERIAVAKAKETRRCRKELKETEERLGVAQVALNNARDDSKATKGEASKCKADFIAEVWRSRIRPLRGPNSYINKELQALFCERRWRLCASGWNCTKQTQIISMKHSR